MTSPSHTDLREELTALADTQTFSPDPSAWDRGRRARRRARAGRVAAAVAAVALVVGVGAVALTPDREAPQPAEVPGGALPSRVDLTNGDFEEDYAIGRASVALAGNSLVLIGAEDGTYHHFGVLADVVALSPDGYRVAWWSRAGIDPNRISLADLRTGEVTDWAFNMGGGGRVTAMSWWPDSTQLLWQGRDDAGDRRAALIDVTGPSESPDLSGRYGARGIPSPSRDIIALPSDGEVAAAPFERIPERGSGRETGTPVDRALPADLHPDGAVVTPVGWADEDTLVAIIDPPPSDEVERPRLALLTSPDVPESEWVYREFLPRLPPEATSFAVDLVPDLTGDPDQELTHDFEEAATTSDDGPGALPYALGALAALLAGLAFVRMVQKQG